MPFEIIRDDITRVRADAIVNTANPEPIFGGGTDAAIYAAAGRETLLEARRALGPIAPGDAAETPAFGLSARHILHTVGPVWQGGGAGEAETLASCYRNCLRLAAELGCASVAFPLIATGVYGFPRALALEVAIREIGRFLMEREMRVLLVVFDRTSFELSGRLFGGIEAYIDEHYVEERRAAEYAMPRAAEPRDAQRRRRALGLPFRRQEKPVAPPPACAPGPDLSDAAPLWDDFPTEQSLDDALEAREETFQQRLFRLIDERGLDDVTVYKRANVDRKVFSTIRRRSDYRPKKKTAVAFAIALRLDWPAAEDLLRRAEIAFSPSSKFDIIVRYCIQHGIYDIYEVNAALFRYGQPILGE